MWRLGLLLALSLAFGPWPALSQGDSLEPVENDDELDKLIQQEQYVIVLFTTADASDSSDALETELAAVREDLVDSLNAWVVKAVDSNLKQRYSPDKEPVVVFFRNKVPVLYDGPANEDAILETVSFFKEPCTKDLTDETFEHLTQAASGATTGDWFVLVQKDADECEECARLVARVETLACKHRGRINVARINRGTTGAVTARRFGAFDVPQFIFFRLGKMYRYTVGKYDLASMTSFINGWYKNVPSEPVPVPKTPFDDLVQFCVEYLREYPWLFVAVVGLPIVLLLLFVYLMRSETKPKTKKKKKKDK